MDWYLKRTNMLKVALICFVLVSTTPSHAQLYTNLPPSELILALQKSNPDSNRVLLLLQLSRKYYFERGDTRQSLDSVFFFLQNAQQLSVELNFLKWQPEIDCYLGKYYYKTGRTKQSIEHAGKAVDFISRIEPVSTQIERWKKFAWNIAVMDSIGLTRINGFEKMESLYRQLKNSEMEIKMQQEIADTYMKQGHLDIAEKELSNVLNKYKAIGFRNLQYTYNLLSVTNRLKGNYDKALHYALLAIESMQQTGDTYFILTFYAHLAFLYHEMGQTKKSIESYKIYFDFDHSDTYSFYFFREVSFFVSDLTSQNDNEEAGRFLSAVPKKYPPQDPYSKAILAKTFADYYKSIEKHSLADKYIQEVITLERSLGKNNEIKRDIEYYIGQYYFEKKQFEKAGNHFEKALEEAVLNNSANTIKDIHLMLFKTDSSLGRYVTAIRHLNQYQQLNDSIFTETKIKEAEEVQVKYETEKKEQNIKLLKQESNLQQVMLTKAKVSRNWILAGTSLLMIIIVLLVYNSRLKQRTNRKQELQQLEIEKQNISLRQLVIEKEWLLKEIHHRVKNNLQIVMSLLNSQSAFIDNEPALTAIQDSQHRVQAMSLIHQKLYNSQDLSSIDISFYIRELATYLRESFNTAQRIHFEFDIERIEMDVSQAVPLGLILNEAITNAIKYAFPCDRNGIITISLTSTPHGEYLLVISDNGIGIPPGININQYGSLGLSLMEGLSEELNGQFSIENNHGTVLKISFAHGASAIRKNILTAAQI